MWSFFSRDPLREFQYEVLEKQNSLEGDSLFCLHRGKSKVTGSDVSIFIYEKSGSFEQLDVARTTLKRLKTLRHPSILAYLDSLETETHIYLATEQVQPLPVVLDEFDKGIGCCKKDFYFSWGIMQVMRAVGFMNKDAGLRHNNIYSGAVFVNNAGEWKVAEVCYMTGLDEPYPQKIVQTLGRYSPPEVSDKKLQCSWPVDCWGLGLLIWEIFNGRMKKKSELKTVGKIPKTLIDVYCELVAANPSERPEVSEVIKRCSEKGGCFNNSLVSTLLFLEEIQIKDKQQKVQFFNDLVPLIEDFPENLCKHRMLPQLLNAFEFGEAGVSVLTPLLKVGNMITGPDYEKLIAPCVVKLFESNDRTTRCKLLQEINNYIDKIPSSMVNQKIFPLVVHGFLDTNPVVREVTVKSILDLAPKLDYNNLNVEVLRHFARIQSKDDQNGIRTNTIVCLGKIAPYIHSQVRQKVLLSAFIRALHDPFPPARVAGILALVACQQFFKLVDIAERVLPALSILTVDLEPSVRENVFRAIKGFLGKLEKVSENPELKPEMENEVTSSSSAMKRGATWAEWAVSAISLKLRSKIEDEKKSPQGNSERSSSNQDPIGTLDPQDSQDEIDVNWPQESSGIRGKCENEYDESSEGWDIEDWGFLDGKNKINNAESSCKVEKWESDSPIASANKKFSERIVKNSPNSKDLHKNKPRQSGPLKLGAKKL